MTLIELMVAVFLLTVGLLALAGTLRYSMGVTNTAERTSAAITRAQEDLEAIRRLPYTDIHMQATRPAVDASADSPANSSVYAPGASCTTGTYTPDPSGAAETLVPCTADPDNPDITPHSWTDPTKGISGKLYPFITFVKNDSSCDATCYAACTTKPQDCLKRIVIAATVDGGSGPKKPIYVSGFSRDPRSGGNPLFDPSTQCTNALGQPVKCTY